MPIVVKSMPSPGLVGMAAYGAGVNQYRTRKEKYAQDLLKQALDRNAQVQMLDYRTRNAYDVAQQRMANQQLLQDKGLQGKAALQGQQIASREAIAGQRLTLSKMRLANDAARRAGQPLPYSPNDLAGAMAQPTPGASQSVPTTTTQRGGRFTVTGPQTSMTGPLVVSQNPVAGTNDGYPPAQDNRTFSFTGPETSFTEDDGRIVGVSDAQKRADELERYRQEYNAKQRVLGKAQEGRLGQIGAQRDRIASSALDPSVKQQQLDALDAEEHRIYASGQPAQPPTGGVKYFDKDWNPVEKGTPGAQPFWTDEDGKPVELPGKQAEATPHQKWEQKYTTESDIRKQYSKRTELEQKYAATQNPANIKDKLYTPEQAKAMALQAYPLLPGEAGYVAPQTTPPAAAPPKPTTQTPPDFNWFYRTRDDSQQQMKQNSQALDMEVEEREQYATKQLTPEGRKAFSDRMKDLNVIRQMRRRNEWVPAEYEKKLREWVKAFDEDGIKNKVVTPPTATEELEANTATRPDGSQYIRRKRAGESQFDPIEPPQATAPPPTPQQQVEADNQSVTEQTKARATAVKAAIARKQAAQSQSAEGGTKGVTVTEEDIQAEMPQQQPVTSSTQTVTQPPGGMPSRDLTPRGASLEAQQQPTVVRSDADYNQLPSGTVFVGPDGKRRRKP